MRRIRRELAQLPRFTSHWHLRFETVELQEKFLIELALVWLGTSCSKSRSRQAPCEFAHFYGRTKPTRGAKSPLRLGLDGCRFRGGVEQRHDREPTTRTPRVQHAARPSRLSSFGSVTGIAELGVLAKGRRSGSERH